MPASREDILAALKSTCEQIEDAAAALLESQWSSGVYENGWNARQLLCHLAADASLASVQITVAKARSLRPGPSFDQDAFNAVQVAARREMAVSEIIKELRSNFERSIEAVAAAPDELLAQPAKLADGPEGPLGDVILEAVREHNAMHLADLRSATG